MAAPGRPTPQPNPEDIEATRPRFKDEEEFTGRRDEINPFFRIHREYGPPLIPAVEAWKWRSRWQEQFKRSAPLYLEIGCGNGFFLAALAKQQPEADFIGIEIRYKRTVLCAKKLDRAAVSNARILRYHAAFLDDLFLPGSLDGIYVNHPDPWSKSRHEKNRLISRWFLEDVARLLKPGGVFRLKSDHLPNIERVGPLLTEDAEGDPLPHLPLFISGRSGDITKGETLWPNDIETNYQSKFRKRGEPVYAIELVRESA
jgi:tRNA (guanine-N7-)-methyltransferase